MKETGETPYLLCRLGELKGNTQLMERAWELSGPHYARAKRHLGDFLYEKNQFAECIPHYKEAVSGGFELFSVVVFCLWCGVVCHRFTHIIILINHFITSLHFITSHHSLHITHHSHLTPHTSHLITHLPQLRINMLYPNTWFKCAVAAMHIGDYLYSVTCFTTVLKQNPEFGEGWSNLASVLMKIGKYNEAYEAACQSIRFLRENWHVWDNFVTISVSRVTWNETPAHVM